VAREQKVDLVVTASQGLSGLKRFLLGTVVERLARNLTCPILVVHAPRRARDKLPKAPPEFKRILLGVNYPPDQRMLEYTLTLAREYRSEVKILHCLEAPEADDATEEIEATYTKAQRIYLESLKASLKDLIPENINKDCEFETAVVLGNPGDQLCLSATRGKADLLLVGVRPQSVWERLVNFSTTEAVLRNAPCPILVIPIGKEEAAPWLYFPASGKA
jgi:nucleotide-binding universal stress UspA family protein